MVVEWSRGRNPQRGMGPLRRVSIHNYSTLIIQILWPLISCHDKLIDLLYITDKKLGVNTGRQNINSRTKMEKIDRTL